MLETDAEGWELEHRLHSLNQFRSRPGPVNAEGLRPLLRELTGLVSYQCNCGWSTGWVPHDSVPLPDEARRLHPMPGYSSPSS